MSFNKLPKEYADQINGLLINCASADAGVRDHARQALADIYSASLSRVLPIKSNSSVIFDSTETYDGDDAPEIPIDTYFGVGEGIFEIWSNGWDGGTQYNELSGQDDFRFRPVTLSTAIAWNIKYAAAARLPVIQQGLKRLFDELVIKKDYLAWTVVADLLGAARTGAGVGRSHVIPSWAKSQGATKKFQIEDVNLLKTLMSRLNTSWANGSTAAGGGLTDLFLSPEMVAEVRRMAYNPMNTYGIPDSAESTALGLPDSVRSEIFRSGGVSEIWGIVLHEMKEFGVGQPYNRLFYDRYQANFATASNPQAPTWDPSQNEIIVGIDRTMNAFASVEKVDARGNSFVMEVDDQHIRRSKKFGYFGDWTGGFMAGNNRAVAGILV